MMYTPLLASVMFFHEIPGLTSSKVSEYNPKSNKSLNANY